MTEFRGTFPKTSGRWSARSIGTAHNGPVIDGTAEVTTRRTLCKSAADIDAARRELTSGRMDAAGPPPARGVFGQRDPRDPGAAQSSGRRNAPHDLFSQAFVPSHFVPSASPGRPEAAERSILARARAFRFRNAAVVVGGFLIGLLAVPVLLLSTPESPVAAPYAVSSRTGLELRDVEASVAPRGKGAVLSVAGTIINETTVSAPVPPLRIALRDDGGDVHAKPVRAAVERLAPGQTVGFISLVAVPAGISGAVSVRFDTPGERRP